MKNRSFALKSLIAICSLFIVSAASARPDSTVLEITKIPFTNQVWRDAVKSYIDSLTIYIDSATNTNGQSFRYYLTMETKNSYTNKDTSAVSRIMFSRSPYNMDYKNFPMYYTMYGKTPIVILGSHKSPIFDFSKDITFSVSSRKNFIEALKPFLDQPTPNYKKEYLDGTTIMFDEYWEGIYLDVYGPALFIVKHRDNSYTSTIRKAASYTPF